MDDPAPKTEELHTDQLEREEIERERARHAELEAEERAHERRADKAGYLRDKLAQRADAERTPRSSSPPTGRDG